MIINTSSEAVQEISSALKQAKSILAEVRDQSNYKSPLSDCKQQQIQSSLSNISKMVNDAARLMEQIETRLMCMKQGIDSY